MPSAAVAVRALPVLLVLFASAGCKGRRPPPERSIPTTTAVATAKPSASAAAATLPDDGMVCTERYGGDAFSWAADGTITKLPSLSLLTVSNDGALARKVELDAKTSSYKLVSVTHPGLETGPLPNWLGHTTLTPSGTAFFAHELSSTRDVQIWRGGAWSPRKPPDDFAVASIEDVVEHEGAFWLDVLGTIYKESGGAIVKVPIDGPSLGVGRVGNEMLVLSGSFDSTPQLFAGTVRKGVVQKGKPIGTLISAYGSNTRLVTNGKSWAHFARGGAYGTIHTSIGGKIANPSREALGVAAIDPYDRVYYRTREGLVALAADGTKTTYPKTAHKLFQIDELRCGILGKGFAALPAPPGSKTGQLRVVVSGAGKAPIAVCPKLPGLERCQNSAEKTMGTLDASGAWSSAVPIGTYEATVQIDGEWLVADLRTPGRTKAWYCEVKENETCTIELRAR